MFTFDSTSVTFDSDVYRFAGWPRQPSRHCRDEAAWSQALAALRPRGAAWRNGGHDGLPGSVMAGFYDALGAVFAPVARRFCELVDEFFCSTAQETLDLWALEYGLPDGCDPFLSLCDKVNAVGDSTTDYAVAAALARGWTITIAEEFITAVEDCAMGLGLAGTLIMGASGGVAWRVTVDLTQSTAYVVSSAAEPIMSVLLMGDSLNCGPDIAPLACLLRRIAPAHADLLLETVN